MGSAFPGGKTSGLTFVFEIHFLHIFISPHYEPNLPRWNSVWIGFTSRPGPYRYDTHNLGPYGQPGHPSPGHSQTPGAPNSGFGFSGGPLATPGGAYVTTGTPSSPWTVLGHLVGPDLATETKGEL
jgi:hypothetical protein